MKHHQALSAATLTAGHPALPAALATPVVWRRRMLALGYGLLCHALFLVGIAAMAVGLFFGLQTNLTGISGAGALLLDGALLLQFPLLHSWFLTSDGRALLRRLAPASAGVTLDTTLFAMASSMQLMVVFALWSPLGLGVWQASGALWWLLSAASGVSWLLLVWSLAEAGLGVQSGSAGWTALWSGERPVYPTFPNTGLHALIRHPIYASFALILWTGPVFSLDKLLMAAAWTLYCVRGPRRKEARYRARYGLDYDVYEARTPAFVPTRASLRAMMGWE